AQNVTPLLFYNFLMANIFWDDLKIIYLHLFRLSKNNTNMKTLQNLLVVTLFFFCLSTVQASTNPQRIVSLNGAITEIICALGHQDKLVGVDVTSTYPTGVKVKAK